MDWTGLSEGVAGEVVVFAVDVAKHDFVGLLSLKNGAVLGRVRWRHPEQTRELVSGIAALGAVAEVEAVMESSGTYGDALRWQLGRMGVALYRVAAKRVHDAAEVYDGVPSLHDAKAVELIGELHARGCSVRWPEQDARRRALQAELRILHQSKQREQALRNRQEALLSRHWPEVLVLLEPGSITLHHLIAAFGGPQQIDILKHQARVLMQQILCSVASPICLRSISQCYQFVGLTSGVRAEASDPVDTWWGGLLERLAGSERADSVWTKRECRERTWGQAGDSAPRTSSLGWGARQARCPPLAPTHSPFAHTAPRRGKRLVRTPAAQQQSSFLRH